MPKSLAKVQKKISKKKGNTRSLNENSKDAQKLRRAGARGEKLERVAVARAKGNQLHSMHHAPDCWVRKMLILRSAKNSILPRRSKSSYGTN